MIADQSLHRGFWGHQAQVGAIVQMCHDLNFRILHLRGIGQQDDDAQRRSICLIRLSRRVSSFPLRSRQPGCTSATVHGWCGGGGLEHRMG